MRLSCDIGRYNSVRKVLIPVSQCDIHVYIQLPHPNAEEPNHQFMFSGYLGFGHALHCVLVLSIGLANDFMKLRPIIKQIMQRMRAGFYFWPRIILTAMLCNPTELLTVNLI